jgi:hypothetical protein
MRGIGLNTKIFFNLVNFVFKRETGKKRKGV